MILRMLARSVTSKGFSGSGMMKRIPVNRSRINARGTTTHIKAHGFHTGYWQQNILPMIENQVSKAGNPGQESLLAGDFADAAYSACMKLGEDFSPERFVSEVEALLGDSKYNAISEIIEECSEELTEAWDYSYLGDGTREPRFGVIGGWSMGQE
jgi:hypothetical protein